jgi:hypothetical protein
MTSLRPLRSTLDALPTVAIGAALMAAAPSVGRSRASNASGYEPSETDCANVSAQPGRNSSHRLAARQIIPSSQWRFGRC